MSEDRADQKAMSVCLPLALSPDFVRRRFREEMRTYAGSVDDVVESKLRSTGGERRAKRCERGRGEMDRVSNRFSDTLPLSREPDSSTPGGKDSGPR